MLLFYYCLTIFIFGNVAASKHKHLFRKLPYFLQHCRRSDADRDVCIKQSIEGLRPYLVKGIPEFGIPPCEPFLVPEIVIKQGKGAVSIYSTYNHVHVTGVTQFLIKSLKSDFEAGTINMTLWFPFLNIISDYDLNGQIMMFPINGNGVCEGNYTDINAAIFMKCNKFERNRQKYFHVRDFTVKLKVSNSTIRLDDLYNGSEDLGEALKSFIADNSDAIVREIKPILEETIGDMFKTYSNNIFHKYPLDELLPP